jgi:hypothetical protein
MFVDSALALTILMVMFESIIMTIASITLVIRIIQRYINPVNIVSMYLSTVIFFGAIYRICFIISFDSLVSVNIGSNSIFSVFILLNYFAVTTMTSCGLGDIVPVYWYSKLCCLIQMGLAVLYSVGIFGFGLQTFHLRLKKTAPRYEFRLAVWFRHIRET